MANKLSHLDRGAIEAARPGIQRSPKRPEAEKKHLTLQPHYVACKPGTNTGAKVQVHQILPFHY